MAVVSAAYDAAQWSELAVAVAGASAALAGLLVVAISINVREILSDPYLPPRAATALIELLAPLVVALLLLIPEQSSDAIGMELLVLGVALAAALVPLNSMRTRGPHRTWAMWSVTSGAPMVLLPGPTFLAGLGVVLDSLGGLYWLPVAVIAAVILGLIQAWTLLIEILR
jgi:hypothetical protein